MTNLLETPPTGPAAALPPPPPGPRPTLPPDEPKHTPIAARFLWKVFAGILVLGALVWGPYQVITLLAHQTRTETQSFAAAGLTTLAVDASTGSITVRAADIDTVQVRARISDGLRKTGESRRVDGDTLRLHSACPNYGSDWCNVDWDVTIPRHLAVTIDSDDGHVSVSGTTAAVDVSTDNGGIELADLGGPVSASTSSGGIIAARLSSASVTADTDNGRVSLVFATAPTNVWVTTDNGRAEVVVPADGAGYRVDAHADNGSEDVTVPKGASSPRSITVRTDNGGISVRTTSG
jgi:hypothetical protein